MQIKMILRVYLTPIRMAKIKNFWVTTDPGKDVEKDENSSTAAYFKLVKPF